MNKKWIFLLLAGLLLLTACAKSTEEAVPELLEPVGVSMDSAIVERGDIEKQAIYTGAVVPMSEELYFTEDGEVGRILVSYGDVVKAGDPLVELNQEALEKQADALERQIAHQAEMNAYENEQLQIQVDMEQSSLNEMIASGISWSDRQLQSLAVEKAQTALDQAMAMQELTMEHLEAQLADMQAQLGTNVLTAPYDGHVVYVSENLVEGEWVRAYEPLLCITDDSTLYAVTERVPDAVIDGADTLTAQIGHGTYTLVNEPYSSEEILAMVLSADKTIHSRFRIQDADADVNAGDYVVLYGSLLKSEDTLIIPANAIYRDETGNYVYKIVEGKRVRQPVETGLVTDIQIEILDGLAEGDEVYVKE